MTDFHPGYLMNAVFYGALGIVMFLAAFYAVIRVVPCDIRKDVVEGKNSAAAILLAAMLLGVSIIVASAVH